MAVEALNPSPVSLPPESIAPKTQVDTVKTDPVVEALIQEWISSVGQPMVLEPIEIEIRRMYELKK